MRPPGEIRQAIGKAARELAAERAVQPTYKVAGATWREIAARACVGFKVARKTVENMANAGELVPAGAVRVEGSRRPMTAWMPPGSGGPPTSLDAVMRGWSRT